MELDNFNYKSFFTGIDNSRKKVKKSFRSSTWICNIPGCKCKAINSHLVQQHPMLESICDEQNKVMQFCDNDLHPLSGDWDFVKLKLLGITEAMSMPLFCQQHDSLIFKEVETQSVDYSSTRVHLLLSYRALCGQRFLEQKRKMLYAEEETVGAPFNGSVFKEEKEVSDYFIGRITSNIKKLWNDIEFARYEDYIFDVFHIRNCGLCASDCNTSTSDLEDKIIDASCIDALKVLYVHILPMPLTDRAVLIVGTDRHNPHPEYGNISRSLQKVATESIDGDLIFRLLVMINNFAMSPDCFSSEEHKQRFVDEYIDEKINYII